MELEFAIIHELEKAPHEKGTIKLSNNLLSKSDINVHFISKLHDIFTNHIFNYSHAMFAINDFNPEDPNSTKKFPNHLNDFLSDSNEDNFKKMTNYLMFNLKTETDNKASKGGYIVFSQFNNGKQLFTVNLIRKTDTFTFPNEDVLDIEPKLIDHLDLDKLAMACQIDLKKLKENKEKYLKFTKNTKMNDVSKYFYDWLNIDEDRLSSTKDNNDNFVKIINLIDPLPVIDGIVFSRDDFKKKVLDYINSKPDKTINLLDLGEQFYPEESHYFLNYAMNNSIYIDSEFKKHTQTLKRLWKFDIEIDSIRLAFKYEDLGKDNAKVVVVDDDTIMIRSPKLVEKVRNEIYDSETNG